MYQGEVQVLHRVMVRLHREGGFPCGILDMQSHRCPNEGQQQAEVKTSYLPGCCRVHQEVLDADQKLPAAGDMQEQ